VLVLDPSGLFTTEVQTDRSGLDRPVLIEALGGVVDAGNGRRIARDHLLAALDSELLITFDIDQLMDYRARRPEMTYTTDHWAAYAAPQLSVHLVRDLNHVPFLLLNGPEPDLQWERFIAAVGLIVAEFDVRLVIGMTAIPMGVPHTRPLTVIAHGTPPELVADEPKWLPTVQVPASVGGLLEYRLGQADIPACGYAVAVPYYVANLDYPQAAETLLNTVARTAELVFPTEALTQAAQVVRGDIDKQVAESEEIASVVRGLEQQADNVANERGNGLLSNGASLPTADELGAEFEQYLSNWPEKDS
jgi:predicted ATP-grasp superfamily ATP-dependent carboligase